MSTLLDTRDPIELSLVLLTLAKLHDHSIVPDLRRLTRRVLELPDLAPEVAEAIVALHDRELALDLKAWLTSPNATVRFEGSKALESLTGRAAPFDAVPEAEAQPLPPTGRGLLLHTAKGDIELTLWNDEAPRTSGNLWSLAKRGFFNGLTFHRVVPDFVAQGGDPRGDGNGGPGYMIRCEVGHRPYVRGTLGMALSGKDTGGSQFFITHTATPHLDGRYTAFGQVTKGMEVVDALMEGDVITQAIALP